MSGEGPLARVTTRLRSAAVSSEAKVERLSSSGRACQAAGSIRDSGSARGMPGSRTVWGSFSAIVRTSRRQKFACTS